MKRLTSSTEVQESYDIARSVEIAAVNLSTSDEAAMSKLQDGLTLNAKRKRKCPKRYLDEESSSSSDDKKIVENDAKSVQKPLFNYRDTSGNNGTDTGGHGDSDTEGNDPKTTEETQELFYDDFFDHHPQYDSTEQKSKNTSIRKIQTLPNHITKSKKKMHSVNKNQESLSSTVTGIPEDPDTLTLEEPHTDKTIRPTMADNTNNNNNDNNMDGHNQNQNPLSELTKQSVLADNTEAITIDAEILKLDCSPNCCAACSIKLDTLLRLVNTILLNQEQSNTHPYVPARSSKPTHQNLLPPFPIENIGQLEEFNKLLLDNNTARTQYIDVINVRRDQDAKKHTRNVLSYIITDEFARPLSWTGQKKTIKVKDMEFVNVLIETITQNNRASSNGMIESAVKSWLQHSGDRIDYRSGAKNKVNPSQIQNI